MLQWFSQGLHLVRKQQFESVQWFLTLSFMVEDIEKMFLVTSIKINTLTCTRMC